MSVRVRGFLASDEAVVWAAAEPSAEHQNRHELAHRPERWKPADLQAWARYVRTTAERYRGRVRHWEIYNEVNFNPPAVPAGFSGSTAEYLELQRIAWRSKLDNGCGGRVARFAHTDMTGFTSVASGCTQ